MTDDTLWGDDLWVVYRKPVGSDMPIFHGYTDGGTTIYASERLAADGLARARRVKGDLGWRIGRLAPNTLLQVADD